MERYIKAHLLKSKQKNCWLQNILNAYNTLKSILSYFDLIAWWINKREKKRKSWLCLLYKSKKKRIVSFYFWFFSENRFISSLCWVKLNNKNKYDVCSIIILSSWFYKIFSLLLLRKSTNFEFNTENLKGIAYTNQKLFHK